ncbi:MAG: branched-chain amino acid ABC transporter permease [Clostridiales bacterium]|nr:branched-chain amino acid ABC transporter permease [Clostridiales bacterium]
MSFWQLAVQQLINGLQSGSIYALVALGYSMVYGIITLLNFAHGDIIMVGSYLSWFALTSIAPFVPLPVAVVIAIAMAILGCMVLGVTIEFAAYRPLRKSPRISLLITAIGVSYLLQNTAQKFIGASAKMVPYPRIPSVNFAGLTISGVAILCIAVTAACMVGLTLLVKKSKSGKAMRAVSEDADAALLMGVNVNSTISFTFAIGSALAGVGSILFIIAYPQASPFMGGMLGLKAFVAAVLGGIGSIPGAMIGGLLIGVIESLVSAVGLSVWKEGVVFAILIVMLLFKPAGIMGKPTTEKV